MKSRESHSVINRAFGSPAPLVLVYWRDEGES